MDKLKTSIKKCARCNQDHNDLEFTKFSINFVDDSDGTTWDYWALCPTNGEPILLKAIEKK